MIANKRVLVVESDQPMRETLVEMLKDRGLKAVGVETGDQAVEELAAVPAYGLVITEMRFAKGQTFGDDLVRIARERGLNLPVIIFTRDVPPCFRSIPGVEVFDKMRNGDPAKMIARIEALAS